MQLGGEGMSQERAQFGESLGQPSIQQARPLLTLDEVSTMLGVSRAWVRDHATRRNPRIPVVRLGGKRAILRFRHEDLEMFIDSHLISSQECA